MRGTTVAIIAWIALGCSSGSGGANAPQDGPKGSGTTSSATIGAAGGQLTHPDGVTLSIPAGALSAAQTLSVTSTTDFPPSNFPSWNSPLFRFAPGDVSFAVPATVSISFTGDPTPTNPTLYWSSGSSGPASVYAPIPGVVAGSTITAPVTSFGSGFVAPGAATNPGGDPCAPYVGSYAGILAFQWSTYTGGACPATSTSGTGTITVHFTTTCLGPAASGQIVLNVTTVSTDDAYFQTLNPSPADTSVSQMSMPPNPPTTGTGAISLGFKHGYIGMGPTVTVTSGAAKISSDVGATEGWQVGGTAPGETGNEPYVAAGMPSDCGHVDSRTFKIDKL